MKQRNADLHIGIITDLQKENHLSTRPAFPFQNQTLRMINLICQRHVRIGHDFHQPFVCLLLRLSFTDDRDNTVLVHQARNGGHKLDLRELFAGTHSGTRRPGKVGPRWSLSKSLHVGSAFGLNPTARAPRETVWAPELFVTLYGCVVQEDCCMGWDSIQFGIDLKLLVYVAGIAWYTV